MVFLAKPVEKDDLDIEEPSISELPVYDLPLKRQKTDLEHYEQQELFRKPKETPLKDEPAMDWEKLKPKPKPDCDEKTPIILGKGSKTGKGTKIENPTQSSDSCIFIIIVCISCL